MDQRALLDLACRAARAATVAILEIYGSDFAVRRKDDRTPVTLADERAEAIILAMLRTEAPAIPVIAEEETAAKGAGAAPPVFWLVDPLDGTREFIQRNGEFTVNVGLVENGRPVLGAVLLPVTGVLYAACGPGTATRQVGDAAPVPIAARRAPAHGAVVAHSRSHADEDQHRGICRDAARCEPPRHGELGQVLPPRGGRGGLLPALRHDDGMGHGGGPRGARGGGRARADARGRAARLRQARFPQPAFHCDRRRRASYFHTTADSTFSDEPLRTSCMISKR